MSTGGAGSATIANRVEILVDNQIANQDKLKELQHDYKAINQSVKDLDQEIKKGGVGTHAQAQEMQALARELIQTEAQITETKDALQAMKEALRELNAEARKTAAAEMKAGLDATREAARGAADAAEKLSDKQRGMASLARATSYAFQDLAQGGLSAVVNNMDSIGSGFSKMIGLAQNLGPPMQALAVVAFVVSQHWETLAKLFGSTPDTRFIDRIHLTKEAMSQLEKQAESSVEKWTKLRNIKRQIREEEAAAAGGVIERAPTEIEKAGGEALEKFIAVDLKGSMSEVFKDIGSVILKSDLYLRDPSVVAQAAATREQKRLEAEVARERATGDDVALGERLTELAATKDAIRNLQKGVDLARDRVEQTFFAQATKFGETSPEFQSLKRYLDTKLPPDQMADMLKRIATAQEQAYLKQWEDTPQMKAFWTMTERNQKEIREGTQKAEQDQQQGLNQAFQGFRKDMGAISADFRQAVKDSPREVAEHTRVAEERVRVADAKLFDQVDRFGGMQTKQAQQAMEMAGYTARDLERTIGGGQSQAARMVAAELKKEAGAEQSAAQKADNAAERHQRAIEAALEKTKLEGYAVGLMGQYGTRGRAGQMVSQEIMGAVGMARAGEPAIPGVSAEEIKRAAPGYFLRQHQAQLLEMGNAAKNMHLTDQQLNQMMWQQIIQGFSASVQASKNNQLMLRRMQMNLPVLVQGAMETLSRSQK